MFNRLLTALFLVTASTSAQTVLQGGSSINNGATLSVAPNPPITVTITPPSANVGLNNTQSFTATLTNDLTNAGVNWALTGPGCVFVSDDFNRPNQKPIGPPWIEGTPGFHGGQILNQVFAANGGAGNDSYADSTYDGGINWPHDQFAQATIVALSGFAGFELNRTPIGNAFQIGITAALNNPGTLFFLNFWDPNAVDLPSFSITPHAGDVYKATVSGAHYQFFVNGVLFASVDDPSGPGPTGRPALNASPNVDNDPTVVEWDNFSAGSITATIPNPCGTISPSFSRSGQTITYTAPSVLPSSPTVTLTATSLQDPSKFATATITITQTAPTTPTIIAFNTQTPKQPGANTLTFAAPNLVGDTPVVAFTAKDGASFTGVVDQLGRSFTSAGCQGDQAGGGHSGIFYMASNTQTITSVVLTSTGTAGGNVDVGYLDMNTGSSSQPDVTTTCGGAGAPTTNPQGPAITTGSNGDVIVSTIVVADTTKTVATPFTFGLLDRGDGMAYAVGNIATYTPSWSTTSGVWAGTTAAFRSGSQPPVIGVSITPNTATTTVSKTQSFTLNMTNDTTHAGATLAISGAGCGSCGTVPGGAIQAGSSFTYTAPASVPTPPNITITATSVADGSKTGTAAVTIVSTPAVGISVVPTSLNVAAGTGGNNVTATVTNDPSNLGVTWALSCSVTSCGSISATSSASGVPIVYTPPSTVNAATSVNLVATTVADATKSTTVAISITPPIQPPANCQPNCPAFPEAQGGGAAGVGGRGGAIIEVTNLNDSGTGSLRACVQATGPRNCVFRVAGLIPVTSGDLTVNNPFLSVDGQTAPGQIIIGGPNNNGSVFRISTHDVIIRYVTISADNKNTASGPSTGTVGLAPTNGLNNNIVMDHVSTRWAGNKMLINVSNFVGPNTKITFQNSLLYEPHEGHPVGPGVSNNPIGCPNAAPDPSLPNPCFSTQETQVDYHHNLFANIDHRIPENDGKSNQWISNIVYNWSFYASAWLGTTSVVDVINNKYVPGNLNVGSPGPGGCASFGCAGPAQTYPIHFSQNDSKLPATGGVPSIYISGNICQGDSAPATDQYGRCAQQISGENGNETGPIPSSWKRSTTDPRPFPITQDAATSLDSIILPTVGNSRHLDCNGNWVAHRDAADARVINQYQTHGAGGFWPNGVTYVGQATIPTPSGTYVDTPITAGFVQCVESLHDGIPDCWKIRYNLSTTDAGLGTRVDPKTGYTYYETYKNGMVP